MNELFLHAYEGLEDSPEVKEALNSVTAQLRSLVPDVEDILTYIGYVYERQGFQNGYRIAMERRCRA